jgi:hypothetical protein
VLTSLPVPFNSPREIVCAPRKSQLLNQQTARGIEERQQMSRGKTAAFLLMAWLAEVLLKRLGIGHRKARPINQKGAMTMPSRHSSQLRRADWLVSLSNRS